MYIRAPGLGYRRPAPRVILIPRLVRRRGVGDASTQQIASTAGTLASATGAIIGATAAIPIAGPIAAGIAALGVELAQVFSGCGQTCIQSTQYANQAENLLNQILSAYMNAPVHYKSVQQAALQTILQAFQQLQQLCSNPALGSAGQRCISERLVRGGTAPWCPNPGHTGCDWYAEYYDPIANDPNVVPDPSPVDTAGAALANILPASIAGLPAMDWLIPAGLLLAAAVL